MARAAEAMRQHGTLLSEAQLKSKCEPGRFLRAGDLTVKHVEVKDDTINALVQGATSSEYPAHHDAAAALPSPMCVLHICSSVCVSLSSRYTVGFFVSDPLQAGCSCEDHKRRGTLCKHAIAVLRGVVDCKPKPRESHPYTPGGRGEVGWGADWGCRSGPCRGLW